MESDEVEKIGVTGTSTEDIDSRCAVNSLILDYYKKFGRKRDLEQFFSLSTAQSDIRDTSGLFWRKMKNENDSSDSGGRKSDSSAHELCRISIRCSLPDPSSQSDDPKTKTESPQTESPPIITDEAPADISRHTDDESFKSDDNHSQKSFDPLLDLSAHKPLSPTSSITSQRKLEWDSLADVGYGNESDRKTSGSSLSTLERLALKQQYSNNDSRQEIGPPTSHSTPLDETEGKPKIKKGAGKNMTKIIRKDVDFVEVNVPHTSDANPPQSINVNLTKHISFNVDKGGGITVDNLRQDINVSPEKNTVEPEVTLRSPVDKEIQTSLPKTKDKSCNSVDEPKPMDTNSQKIPVMISFNTLRKKLRRKKSKVIRRKIRSRTKINHRKEVPPQEKSGEQLSEAESFEYMPGHIYNQNQMKANEVNEFRPDHNSTAGNKSSLESSGGITTDSSKASKHSLTHDLEKCIQVLKVTLQKRYDDSDVKKKLIKEVVQRLLNSRYRDDETTTDFLSGLSFSSKKLNLTENNTTTSTSDTNNTDYSKHKRPRKSILRMEKFDSNVVTSSSQSAPNLFTATSTDKLNINLPKVTSNTESDESSKGRASSDNALPKTSSEELYLKYLEALKREESYKRHLRDKELFLKQKLGSSDIASKAPISQEVEINNRIKDLMKDLVKNNYGDGSGDAINVKGGSLPERNVDRYGESGRCARSHSVFTLSSSPEFQKKPNLNKKKLVDKDFDATTSKNHYCCCPHHSNSSKVAYVDSSVQVNIKCEYENETTEKPKQDYCGKCPNCQRCEIPPRLYKDADRTPDEIKNRCKTHDKPKRNQQNVGTVYAKCGNHNDVDTTVTCQKHSSSPRNITRMVPDKNTGDIKYICVCKDKPTSSNNTGEIMIYKCAKLTNRGIQFEDPANEINTAAQCGSCKSSEKYGVQVLRPPGLGASSTSSENTSNARGISQFSQTDLLIKMLGEDDDEQGRTPGNINLTGKSYLKKPKKTVIIYEATRSVQTEISFNPQIAEPTLKDMVIINNCVKLICEQRREKDISSDSTEQRKTFSDVYTTSDADGRFLLSPEDSLFRRDSIFLKPVDSVAFPEKVPNDYNIPILGTNMTLRVTLASMENKDKERKEQVSQACGTTRASIVDQGTYISAECSKSVQCQSSTKPSSTKSSPSPTDHSSNKSSSGRVSPRKSCLSKSHASRSPTRSTYPKTVQLKEKKPFRRSNTDTGKLETCCGNIQTDSLKKNLSESPRKQSKSRSPENCCQARDTGVDKATSRKKDVLLESPRTQSKSKPATSESCCQARDIGVDQMTPQSIESLIKSPRKQPISKPATSESFCQTKNPNIDKIHKQVLLGSPRKQPESKPTTSKNCCQTNDADLIISQDRSSSPESQRKQFKSTPVTSESSCQTLDPNTNKFVLTTSSKSSGEDTSVKQEIGIQKDSSEDELHEKTPTPEMISKGVGNQSMTPKQSHGISCQTDDSEKDTEKSEENNNEKVEKKDKSKKGSCGNRSVEDIHETQIKSCKGTDQESKPKKTTCDNCGSEDTCQCGIDDANGLKDPIMNMIQDITRRYSKTDILKIKKKKCFNEIVSVLNYLLETEDSTDQEPKSVCITPESSENWSKQSPEPQSPSCCDKNSKKYIRQPSKSPTRFENNPVTCFQKVSKSPMRSDNNNKKSKVKPSCCDKSKKVLKHTESESLPSKHDKGIQLSSKSTSKCTESSDLPRSTDLPSTSDSTACKILNKIKRECEKYHLRKNKGGRKCEVSSSTSINCENCKKVHHCGCRHKCKRSKTLDKYQKKCVAYNLILQTSESMLSEETICNQSRPLQNIVVKVPKRKQKLCTETCKETIYKIEKGVRGLCSPRDPRSRSCPKESEMSSTDDYIRRTQQCTVREYLERNRPDFVEKCSERQNCLKFINEIGPQDPGSPRLKMIVVHQPTCTGSMGNNTCGRGVPMCYNPCDPCNPCSSCNPNPCNPCESCNLHTISEVTRVEQTNAPPTAACCHCTWTGNRI